MRVLCFDPSGNFEEGKGTTGWAYFEDGQLKDFGHVSAEDYRSAEMYWESVASVITQWYPNVLPDVVVMESFQLFAHKSKQQSWSYMETPQLIGFLRMVCYRKCIDLIFQDPKDKQGVGDGKLERLGIIEDRGQSKSAYYALGRRTNIHERDAIRHGVYYFRYGKGKVQQS